MGSCEYGNEHWDYTKSEENPLSDVRLSTLKERIFSIELVTIVNLRPFAVNRGEAIHLR
jgi:hypothetical protein